MLKRLKRLRRLTIFKVPTTRVPLQRPVLSQWPGPKKVGGGAPPPGGFQSAAHRRCAERVRLRQVWFCKFCFLKLFVKNFFQTFWLMRLMNPLFFSLPGAWGPPPPARNLRILGQISQFFGFKKVVRNLLRKNIEKNAKIIDFGGILSRFWEGLGSQNH